ncbi:MAG: hypothetical protein LUQ18_08300, partial [Methylococcaceae bacterium]|nr:hypothetical protein [Methylococcaceae bacterium]
MNHVIVPVFRKAPCGLLAKDKSLWRYFRNHWHDWFPNLGSRANFVKQSANLWLLKEQIMK